MKKVYILASLALITIMPDSIASRPMEGAGEAPGLRGPRQQAGPAEGTAVQRQQTLPDALSIKGNAKGAEETLKAMTGPNEMMTELDQLKVSLPKSPKKDQYIILLKAILKDRHDIYKEIYDEYLKPGVVKKQALSRKQRLDRNLEQFQKIEGQFLEQMASMPGVDNENLRIKLKQMDIDLTQQYDDLINALY